MGIHANESFSLEVVVGLFESREVCELLFNAMMRSGLRQHELNHKPSLSDEHSSLMSGLSNKGQFICVRDLIE
jgi:hypothetical protein